ncbi:hypothetical protein MKW92_006011 [Papaver armeniacum]|nr:hypothetical protein MKW92_006011 [Papaver armeniacum]
MDSSTSSSSGGGGPSTSADGGKAPRKPKYSKFFQQEMPSCKPHLTPKLEISVFVLIGVIFIPIGVACLLASKNVVEIVDRYDADCIPPSKRDNPLSFIQNATYNKSCTRKITVTKNMTQPIYVYYQLENFHQNHRRYFMSRSDAQLRDIEGENDTESCKPEAETGDGQPIVPCGLIAWSLFNDTFSFIRSQDNRRLPVNKTGISWKSERSKFGANVFPKNFQNGSIQGGGRLNSSLPLNQQEDLIVWMRPAAFSTFRKLYGRIEEDLIAGETIQVNLENNYNSYGYGGKKKLVLSTASSIGGKNNFLGFAYLTVGGVCLAVALLLTILYILKPRRGSDDATRSWKWNMKQQNKGQLHSVLCSDVHLLCPCLYLS